MNNKQIIKDILIEELSKCNNFNYHIDIGNLYLIVNTKKLYQSLIDNSSYFEGDVESKWRLYCYDIKYFHLSYEDIWSKFEDKTKLDHYEIQSIVKEVLEEGFKIKGIIPYYSKGAILQHRLEEGFKIKGITAISILPALLEDKSIITLK